MYLDKKQCAMPIRHCTLRPPQIMVIVYDLDASQDGQRESSSTPINTLIGMHVIIDYIITQI